MTDFKNNGLEEEFFEDEDIAESSMEETIFKIRYWNTTYTFDRVAQLYKKEKFKTPDLQRSYVWSRDMASRLIDSILLGIPLPNFFIYKNHDDSNDIIDGLQRIITIATFINGDSLPSNSSSSIFRLSNSSSISSKWRGKSFKELSLDEQDRIKDGEAAIVFFEQRFPNNLEKDIKKHVFERINTGGVKLTPQEIRNALYPGIFNDEIKKLSLKWRQLEHRFSDNDYKNYKIDELILRILTVDNIVKNEYSGLQKNLNGDFDIVPIQTSIVLKTQMDNFMEKYQKGYERVEIFEKALDYYYKHSDNLNFIGRNTKKINPVYAETLFVTVMRAIDSQNKINLRDSTLAKIKQLNSDEKLPFTRRTTNKDNLKSRLEIFKNILID